MKKIILIFFALFFFVQTKAEVTYLEILKNPTDLKLNLRVRKRTRGIRRV